MIMPSDEEIANEANEEGETPAHEKEEYNENGDSGVVIPEDFQKKVHELMEQAKDKHHLSHIREMVYAKEDALREAEMAKKGKGKKNKSPEVYSTEDMPVG